VKPFPVVLAATLHDPTAALARDVVWALPRLRGLFGGGIAVTTSPPTSPRMVELLRAGGVFAGTPRTNMRGSLYRMAVREALATGAAFVHYLDFDRALHWMHVAPRELAAVLRLARRHPAIIVGRTEKAHASHHRPLWATEGVANRLMADALGVRGRFDLLVPSFVLRADLARSLVVASRARDAHVYGEWPALVAGLTPVLAYVECRGLDWETPDRFRAAVRRVGLATWRRRQETAAEWTLRIAMAETIVASFSRRHARQPARPKVVRLSSRGIPVRSRRTANHG
jgi:hypothetical protein